MKRQLLLLAFAAAFILTSCGGKEEKKEELPSFCDCVKAKGSPPSGCDKVITDDMTDEEFQKKYTECKD